MKLASRILPRVTRIPRTLVALGVSAFSLSACEEETQPPPAAPLAAPAQPASTGAAAAASEGQEIQIGVDDNEYADSDPSAVTEFKPALENHGAWVDDGTYGTVWVPNATEVGPDFVPYSTAGHWVYENDDYLWVSDYEWGWAPYHYGRWVYIDGRGWAWIPGRRYAPAWVVWRTGPDGYGYVGWGPMAPAFIWYGGVAVVVYARPEPRYVYCARGDVFSPVVATRVVPREQGAVIAGQTHPYEGGLRGEGSGRTTASPVVHGPAPAALGIDGAHVAHAAPNDPRVTRAQTYATPSTARPQGATPPQSHTVRVAPPPRSSPAAPVAPPRRPSAPAPAPRSGGRPRR
jgi:hypothetical protein